MKKLNLGNLKNLDYGRVALLLALPLLILPFQNCGRVFDKEDPQVVYANPSLGRSSTSRLPTSGSSSSSTASEVGSIGTGGSSTTTNTGTGTGTGGTGTGSTTVPGGSNIPAATPVPTPAPTPVPTPVATPIPSSQAATTLPHTGQSLARNCTLSQWAVIWNASTDIGYGLNYQWCLILGRTMDNNEGYFWYHGIKDGNIDPDQVAPALFASPEFPTRYQTPLMTNDQFIVFASRLLMFREPLPQEVAQLTAMIQGMPQAQAQQTVIQAIPASPGFGQANPYLVQLHALYD